MFSGIVRKNAKIIRNEMKRLPVFFVLFFSAVVLYAQAPTPASAGGITKNLFMKHFGTREGLTQPGITAVLTDSDGAVWIGTRYRLNKYVNGNLEAYDYAKLGGSYIYMLFEDSDRNVWVATESGLLVYDRHSDTFTSLYDGRIRSAAEADGKIYFSGIGDIVVYDRSDATLSFIQNGGESFQDVLAIDDHVLIFADKTRGLFSYNTQTGNLGHFPVPELEGKLILCAAYSDDDLYVATYMDGLYQIGRDGKVVTRYSAADYPSLRIDVICDICPLDGRICLATDGSGICTVVGDRIVPLKDIPGYAGLSALPPALTRIYQDAYSNIWAGSVKDGLYGIRQTPIHRIDDFSAPSDAVPENSVILSLCQDGKDLWIGTDDGVIRYAPDKQSIQRIASTRGCIISSICLYGPDALLVSVYCKGLYVVDKTRGTRKRLFVVDETVDRKELQSGFNQTVYNISDTEILIAGQNVYGYDVNKHTFTPFSVDYGVDPSGLHPFMHRNCPDTVNAYSPSKLYRLDLVRNRITFLSDPGDCGRINSAVSSGRKIYFGTDTGLSCYDESDRSSTKLYPEVFSRVTNVCERNDSTLWIIADNTLYSFNRKRSKVEIFDEAEGFIANEVTTGVLLDGTFYFGGNYELSAVPGDIGKNVITQPSLSLSRVMEDGRIVVPKDGRLRVAPQCKDILLEFRLRKGNPFGRTLLKYSIDGEGQTRTYDNTFSISSLPPGKHTVYASVFQADGTWGAPEKMLTLIVPETLVRNKWFHTFLILALIGTSLLVIKRSLRRANAKAQSVIRENKEEDRRRRSRFVRSIALELDRPLSQIKKSIQVLLSETAPSDKNKPGLERIYAKSVQMETILHDAVEQEQTTAQENPFLDKFARLVEENLHNNKLSVSFLTKEMAMSRTILYDKIKLQTGMGINEYIQKSRLQKARQNLIETDKSITDISDELGFTTPKYFSVLFKSTYGVTPREFRKQIKPL